MAVNDLSDADRPGRPPGRAAVRITDVAKAAGVSAITVSRALNTPDQLSKATLRRVLKAVSQLGYVPNLTAGALSSRRSRMVVAIVPTIASPMYAGDAAILHKHLVRGGLSCRSGAWRLRWSQ
jgi:LacI family gluconate utilization system Gnt-I transcriptional repressor